MISSVPDPAVDAFREDASGYRGEVDRVFAPSTLTELQEVVRTAGQERIPLTVAGAGTGLTGGRVPHGGWILSLRNFLRLDIQTGVATVGAGVLLQDLQRAAQSTRQFFGPNPTESSASIGGIINTNASGSRSFRYGSVRGHVLALEVTFIDGRTRRFQRGDLVDFPVQSIRRSGASKNSAGYYLQAGVEWVDLLCGSEGTLGIVTEAELRLLPEPGALLSAVIFFHSDNGALNAVDAWRDLPGIRLLEYLDASSLEMVRPRVSGIPAGAQAGLLIEQELASDDDPELDLWSARLAEHGALEDESWFGLTAADRERFYEFRHILPVMVLDRVRRNGFHKFGTDFAVPREHGRDLLRHYREQCDHAMPGKYVIYGHIGDANSHLNLFPESPAEVETCAALMTDFARYAVALGGTVAAEHGIGKIKTELFRIMYSEAEIGAMLDVKKRLDPNGLLGQGNIFGITVHKSIA
jgi:FAD/FMN-containing dehydrogenase